MRFLRDMPIKRKVLCITMGTCGVALVLACSALFWFQSVMFRQAFVDELRSLGDVVARNSAAPLAFADQGSAEEVLSALKVKRHIVGARILDSSGRPFAAFGIAAEAGAADARQSQSPSKSPSTDAILWSRDDARLEVSIPVQDAAPGRLQIWARFEEQYRALRALYAKVLIGVLIGSLLVMVGITSPIQKILTGPIAALAEAARGVSEDEDYGRRVPELGRDEVGLLTRTFNRMLQQIQERDAALQQAQAELERRVESRTHELSQANAQLNREIEERRLAERRLATAFDELEIKVSERTRELSEAKTAAEAASQAKSRFLAMMSHEIRTPLNGVTGVLHLLRQDQLTPAQLRWTDMAQVSAETLLRVINDILDFSKVEAGKLELRPARTVLPTAISRSAAPFAQRAAAKGLRWSLLIDPSVPSAVETDSDRLAQVLGNLLGNAVKFTDTGSLGLRVTLETETSDVAVVVFEVFDTGPGLAPEQIKHLFLPFSQVDNSSTRRHGGTGLGLGICRELVQLMGGRIGVRSQPGKGSTFWFEMPFRKSEPWSVGERAEPEVSPPTPRWKANPGSAEATPKSVLLAEDNAINRELAREMIVMAGFRCECVENGREAVRAVRGGAYDLVFMDCMMPEMDGLEATRAIRAEEAEASTPSTRRRLTIVAMTANAMAGDREECLASGMDDYLSKPLNPEAVVQTLQRWLARAMSAPGRG